MTLKPGEFLNRLIYRQELGLHFVQFLLSEFA